MPLSYLHPHLKHKQYQPGMLTLPEVNQFIINAALAAGFVPISEWRIVDKEGNKRDLDWVWLDPKAERWEDSAVVAAFEIDAPDMPKKSVLKALATLGYFNNASCHLVLYELRKFEVKLPRTHLTSKMQNFHEAGIEVISSRDIQKAKFLNLRPG